MSLLIKGKVFSLLQFNLGSILNIFGLLPIIIIIYNNEGVPSHVLERLRIICYCKAIFQVKLKKNNKLKTLNIWW